MRENLPLEVLLEPRVVPEAACEPGKFYRLQLDLELLFLLVGLPVPT